MRGKPSEAGQEQWREQIYRNQKSFLETEIQICFTFVSLAQTRLRTGQTESAVRAMEDAEKGYSTLRRFLSDEKHAGRFTDEERHMLTQETGRLRGELDALRNRLPRQAGDAAA